MPHPLLELMRRGESGAAGYNAFNRGTYTDSQGGEHIRPGTPPIDFSSLTVGQVMDLQAAGPRDPDRLFAVGKYQVIPRTMRGAVAALHIDRDEPFTPALQDRIFTDYLITQKRPSIQGYIVGRDNVTLEQAQHELACEWASFGDPRRNGASHYSGANHASITLQQSAGALNQMRTQYQQAIAHGATPAQAWRNVTDSNAYVSQAPPTGAQAPTPLADGLLRQGESGDAVKQLQHRLNRLGVKDAQGHALGEDGRFGRHTQEAVVAFQHAHGLEGRGVVGPKTRAALDAAERSQPQSAATHVHAVQEPARTASTGHPPPVAEPTHAVDRTRTQPVAEPTRGTAAGPAHHAGTADHGALAPGAHGPDVTRLQSLLNRLGYTDGHHRALATDGLYGQNTRHAVRAFQRDHGLDGQGVAGSRTQAALAKAEAGLMTHPGHPQHAMFERMLSKVHEAEARAGVRPGPHSEKMAATLVVEQLREGITRVDRVEFNDSGTLARAVQVSGNRDEPALNRSTDAISIPQAMRQSVAESSQQAHQVAVNVQAQQAERARVQHAPAPAHAAL